MQNLKTGALFRFACEAGAVLAREDTAPLRQFADNIGLAYQIADDILDVETGPAELGKATFVSLLGLDAAKRRAEALTEAAISALDIYGPPAETLREAARFMVTRRK
jgi:farnesyl diphosphate synthase